MTHDEYIYIYLFIYIYICDELLAEFLVKCARLLQNNIDNHR